MANIAMAENHNLFRIAVAARLEKEGHRVILHAESGEELLSLLARPSAVLPDILLLDLHFGGMKGADIARILSQQYPALPFIALTADDCDYKHAQLIALGARGYLRKEIDETELFTAIKEVLTHGYYCSKETTGLMFKQWGSGSFGEKFRKGWKDKQVEFLQKCCEDKSYKEIADEMGIPRKTIDNYVDALYKELGVVGRVGLVLFAVREGIVSIHPR